MATKLLSSTPLPHLVLLVLSSTTTSNEHHCDINDIEELPIEVYQEMYNRFTGRSQLNSSELMLPENTSYPNLLAKVPCGLGGKPPYVAIVGGRPAPEKVFPWQVALSGGGKFCGGSLISNTWVLTAAHCLKTNKSIAVLGSLKLFGDEHKPYSQERTLKVVVVHASYNPTSFYNDIALAKLNAPVKFNDYIQPICLPKRVENFEGLELCYVSGWGKISPNGSGMLPLLQFGRNSFIPQTICAYTWRLFSIEIDPRQICTDLVGPSVCFGDSGGPISCKVEGRYRIVGLTSFISRRDNCMGKLLPNVFVRISEYTGWIMKVIDKYGL